MRTIKFRGLRTDGKGWVYGFYTEDQHGNCYIVDISENPTEKSYPFFEVIPKTVGQFTGFKDNQGREIYEGDTIGNEIKHEIFFSQKDGEWAIDFSFETGKSNSWSLANSMRNSIIIISDNIHENSELLNQK